MAEQALIEDQVFIILRALQGKKLSRDSPIFTTTIKWITNFPTYINHELKQQLKRSACETFDITEAQLLAAIEGTILPDVKLSVVQSTEDRLRSLLPKGGWFEWYDEYTRYNEAPLSYHIFSSLCVLGSCLGRRVYFDMGHFKVWPNYCAILVGPTGKVKKTTAADIAKEMIVRHMVCPVMSDEPTPQALSSALQASGHQFIYAGEMSVFFGKDKFKEGMVPKILRMLDSPEKFEIDTVGRGVETITNLAISFLGGTTPSLFTTSMPQVVTSSGFMNRFVIVVEQSTERVFPRPYKGRHVHKLDETIQRFKKHEGLMDFAPGVEKGWWDSWYRKRKKIVAAMADETLIEVMERLPMHLLRTAMLMHLVQCDNFQLCEKCLQDAENLMLYVEKNTPGLIQTLKQSAGSNETEQVYSMLVRLGGAADHSTLLRRMASKMNAQQFKTHINTLSEQGRLKVSKKGFSQYYIVTEETT